jgi:hypothetical protein
MERSGEPDVDSRRPTFAGLSTGHPTMRSYPGVRFRGPRPRTGAVSPVTPAHACGARWPRPPAVMHGRRPRVDGHGPFGSCPASHASTSSMVHRPLDRGLRTQRSRPKRRSQMVYRSSCSTGRRCLSGGAPGIGFRVHLHSRVAWSLLTSQPSCSARHRFSNSRPARSTASFPLAARLAPGRTEHLPACDPSESPPSAGRAGWRLGPDPDAALKMTRERCGRRERGGTKTSSASNAAGVPDRTGRPDHGAGANLTAVVASESVEVSFPPMRRTDPSARAMVQTLPYSARLSPKIV